MSELARSMERQPLRPLPIALAHQFSKTRIGDPAQGVLNRIYAAMTLADQVKCRWELLECRAAKRGEREARAM